MTIPFIVNAALSTLAILVGGICLAKFTGTPLAGLIFVATPLLWLTFDSATLCMIAFGLAAALAAKQERWGWAGVLAGVGAVIEPGGLILVGVLALLAAQNQLGLNRYWRPALVAVALTLLVALFMVHTPTPLSAQAVLTLLPLTLAGLLAWRTQASHLRTQPIAMALLAWGALDALLRLTLHQPLSAAVVPALAYFGAVLIWPTLSKALIPAQIAILIGALSVLPFGEPPALALRLPDTRPTAAVALHYGPDLTLTGIVVDQNAGAGQRVRLRLVWQVYTLPTAPLTIKIDFLDRQNTSVLAVSDAVPAERWQPGSVTTDHVAALPALPPGVLDVYVTALYEETPLAVHNAARVIVPLGARPVDLPTVATFANGAILFQPVFEVQPDHLNVRLTWQSSGPMDRDYKLFLHVQDAAQHILTQYDAEPRGGNYPTSLWQPGDVIDDAVPLDLAHTPLGDYVLWFGFYADQARLKVRGCTAESLQLASIHVAPDRSLTVAPISPEC